MNHNRCMLFKIFGQQSFGVLTVMFGLSAMPATSVLRNIQIAAAGEECMMMMMMMTTMMMMMMRFMATLVILRFLWRCFRASARSCSQVQMVRGQLCVMMNFGDLGEVNLAVH